MLNRRRRGERFEYLAEELLAGKGFVLLERNYRTRYGELDRVMRDGEAIVIVEVKMRRGDTCGSALEAVDERKLRQLWRMAEQYLGNHPELEECELRFDVVAIDVDGEGRPSFSHLENIEVIAPEDE